MGRATVVQKRRAPTTGALAKGVLDRAHICKFCDKQAKVAIIHADGRAFVAVCAAHKAKGRASVEDIVEERTLPMTTKSSDEPMQPGAIDVTKLTELSDSALEKTSILLHEFYEDFFVGNDDETAEGLTRKHAVMLNALCSEELLKRSLEVIDDELTKATVEVLAELEEIVAKGSEASVEYRFTKSGIFVGLHLGDDAWEIHTHRAGVDVGEVDDTLAKRIAGSFNLDGDRYTNSLRSGAPARKMVSDDTAKSVVVDSCKVERGLQSDTHCEFFLVGKIIKGTLVLSFSEEHDWSASIESSCLPKVLTGAAVKAKAMPADGKSGMPASLEAVTPAEFQFWKAAGEDARKIRDALVASRFYKADNVRIVNGEYRRVVTKTFLYVPPAEDTSGTPAVKTERRSKHIDAIVGKRDYALVTSPPDGTGWGTWLADIAKQVEPETVLVITDSRESADITELVNAVATLQHDYALGVHDSNNSRTALVKIGSPFKHHRDEDFVWVYSGAVAKSGDVLFLDTSEIMLVDDLLAAQPDIAAERTKSEQVSDSLFKGRILKTVMPAEGAVEERYVLGIVLEPELVDLQNDIYSKDEIRQAAHKFMEEFQNMGFMHRDIINDQVKLLESYLLPGDLEIAGVTLKEGTWLMGVRVLNDSLWKLIKDGELTGFSIGGSAIRVSAGPADGEADAA